MAASVVFLLAQLALGILGAGLAWHPSVRSLSLPARAAAAFCAGAVGLTVEATLFSLANVPWSIPVLSLPLLAVSGVSAARWSRLPSPIGEPLPGRRSVAAASWVVVGAAFLYLAVCFGSTAATSVDFLYFWGVKAVRFAGARGIDWAFLADTFTAHAPRDYPPLVPVVGAWGCLAAGRMPWRIAPLLSALWFAAAVPILFERCRRRLGDAAAAAVVAFWTVALSISLVSSLSAGGAEPALLFFESVAVAWLLTERAGESRFLPAIALCGAALTKVEGLPAAIFIVVGTAVRDRVRGTNRPVLRALSMVVWPAAAAGLWFLYEASHGLPAGYRGHGKLLVLYGDQLGAVLRGLLRHMDAGSYWLPWVFAAVLVLRRPSAWHAAAPALVLAGGLMAFLAFDYLHDQDDPAERIEWTAPRVTQPALSALILAAGIVSFTGSSSRWRTAVTREGPRA